MPKPNANNLAIPESRFDDVRMRGFSHRTSVEACITWLDEQTATLSSETVPAMDAASRVLAADVVSKVDVPGFDRAMMDGYALRADDTLGASTYNRLRLKVIGSTLPGKRFPAVIASGQAARIMTGAPLPQGADAVLPVELSQPDGSGMFALESIARGKHIGLRGEDVAAGSIVCRQGRKLRPQDIGLLSSVGASMIEVVRRPRVRMIITGDELLAPGQKPSGVQIVDANGPMLSALLKRDGAQLVDLRRIGDNADELRAALSESADVDVVIVSGGSSVGEEDHAPRLVGELGRLAIHGVAMRPSSPAGMGTIAGKLVFLLPGNPVSAFCAYDFFAGRAIRALGGLSRNWPYQSRRLPLAKKLVSTVGRVDYARVVVQSGNVIPLATSGASILSSTSLADGFVVVPCDSEGYAELTEVEVYLYD